MRQHTNTLCLFTIQQSILNELHNANYFNNRFAQSQGTSYYKKKLKNFTFCLGESRENFINIFQDFPGLTNKIQGLSRTFQDSKKNPGLSRTFPGCGNPAQFFFAVLCFSVVLFLIFFSSVFFCLQFQFSVVFLYFFSLLFILL